MRARWKILIAVAVVLMVVILISVGHHFQLRSAVEKYQAELKAQGVPMELTQILPPPVASNRDGTELFLKASHLLMGDTSCLRSNTIYAMKTVAPGRAMVCSQQPDVRNVDADGYTNSWETLQIAARQNQEALNLFQKILQQPEINFHICYEKGFSDTNFFGSLNLVEMKRSSLWLNGMSVLALHAGDNEAAVKNNVALLTLVHAAQSQRLIISELVRIACASIAQGGTWEILQSANVTDNQLAMLQTNWMRLDFIQGHKDALNMERIVSGIELERWRGSSQELDKFLDLFVNASKSLGNYEDPTLWQKFNAAKHKFLWRHWWSYSDQLRSLKGYAALLESMRAVEAGRTFQQALKQQAACLNDLGIAQLNDSMVSVFSGEIHLETMLSESIQTMGKTLNRVMGAEINKHLTVTAIALKRFQLKHGKLPEKLSELTPEFLASVSVDFVDGQPLRYRRNADGTYLLYSIGEDGKDDGGNPSLEKSNTSSNFFWQNPRALDWVWPQPATPAEVQFFFDHPPK